MFFNKHLIYLLFFLISSCSYHNGVYIKNDTEKKLSVNVQFKTNKGYSDLNFSLDANDYDAWEYEAGYYEKNQIDASLIKIVIKTESGCERTYSRDDIIKISVKRGMCKIFINKELIKC